MVDFKNFLHPSITFIYSKTTRQLLATCARNVMHEILNNNGEENVLTRRRYANTLRCEPQKSYRYEFILKRF
jgi:hypothetical protein